MLDGMAGAEVVFSKPYAMGESSKHAMMIMLTEMVSLNCFCLSGLEGSLYREYARGPAMIKVSATKNPMLMYTLTPGSVTAGIFCL